MAPFLPLQAGAADTLAKDTLAKLAPRDAKDEDVHSRRDSGSEPEGEPEAEPSADEAEAAPDGPRRASWVARVQRSAQALSAAARSSRKHFAPSQRAVQVAQKLAAGPKFGEFAPKKLSPPKLPMLRQASVQKGPVEPQDPPWCELSAGELQLKRADVSDEDLVSTRASTAEGDEATSVCSTSETEVAEDERPPGAVLETEVAIALGKPELAAVDFCGLSPAKFTMALSVAGVLMLGVFEVAENTAKDKVRVYSDVFALLYTCPVFVPVGLLMLSDIDADDGTEEPNKAKLPRQYGRFTAALIPLAYAAFQSRSVITTVLTALAPPGTCASIAMLGQLAFARAQARAQPA